jgi:CubicO group peptidase (beta-lactamase class C family)
MKIRFIIIIFVCFAILLNNSCTKDYEFTNSSEIPDFPNDNWIQVSDVEYYSWSLKKLKSAEEFSKSSGSECVMIIENGKLIYSWGENDKKFYVASIRKSFLSLIYGYFVGNQISLNSTLQDYNIDDKNPQLNDLEKQATIRTLLTSSSGVYHKAAATDNENLPERNSTKPGEIFYYNNWDFNALGTIFEQQTGQKIFQVFNDSIAIKIGLQDFDWQNDGRYDYSDVSIHPAYHFDMTARDMARTGLLVLNNGKWNGKQIIPENWIDTITSNQISVSKDYGGGSYGFMWWVNKSGYLVDFSGVSIDAISAQGNLSQIILIIPSKNLVIVHRATKNLDPSRMLQIIRMIINSKK